MRHEPESGLRCPTANMTMLALVRGAALALSIAFSWNQFILIFARGTSIAVQFSVATSVASTIVISGAGLAYQHHSPAIASAILASGLLAGALIGICRLARPPMTCLSAVCLLAYLGTMSG